MVRVLLWQWVQDGWLAVADPSRRKRAYELTAIYRQYIGALSAVPAAGGTEPKSKKSETEK
jgi:hypothetical protein